MQPPLSFQTFSSDQTSSVKYFTQFQAPPLQGSLTHSADSISSLEITAGRDNTQNILFILQKPGFNMKLIVEQRKYLYQCRGVEQAIVSTKLRNTQLFPVFLDTGSSKCSFLLFFPSLLWPFTSAQGQFYKFIILSTLSFYPISAKIIWNTYFVH